VRDSGETWGGLALFGIGPNVGGIAKGDALVAITMSADGAPADLSVSLIGSAGGRGSFIKPGAGELRLSLRNLWPQFRNAIFTMTRADGTRNELVARIDLQNPANLAAFRNLLRSPSLANHDRMVDRFRQSGRITLTKYDWHSTMVNPEVGVGAVVRFGGEGTYASESYRNRGTSVLFWGPLAALTEQQRREALHRLRQNPESIFQRSTVTPATTPAPVPTRAPAVTPRPAPTSTSTSTHTATPAPTATPTATTTPTVTP
jgi:hypothetical protein